MAVSTHLKHTSQMRSFPQVGRTCLENIWNHHPEMNRSYQLTKTTTLSVASGIAPKIISLKRSSMSSCNLRLKQSLQENRCWRPVIWHDMTSFHSMVLLISNRSLNGPKSELDFRLGKIWLTLKMQESISILCHVCALRAVLPTKRTVSCVGFQIYIHSWLVQTLKHPENFSCKNSYHYSPLSSQKSGPNNPHFSLTVLETET